MNPKERGKEGILDSPHANRGLLEPFAQPEPRSFLHPEAKTLPLSIISVDTTRLLTLRYDGVECNLRPCIKAGQGYAIQQIKSLKMENASRNFSCDIPPNNVIQTKSEIIGFKGPYFREKMATVVIKGTVTVEKDGKAITGSFEFTYGLLDLNNEIESNKTIIWESTQGLYAMEKPWAIFLPMYCIYIEDLLNERCQPQSQTRPLNPYSFACFQELASATHNVTSEKAYELIEWGYTTITKAHNLYIEMWSKRQIHGFYGSKQCEKILRFQADGIYIVRFSENPHPGSLTITIKLSPTQITHIIMRELSTLFARDFHGELVKYLRAYTSANPTPFVE